MIKGKKVVSLKVAPIKFNVILVIGLLLFFGSFTLIKVYALESENDILRNELNYERFDDGNFPNVYIKLVYEKYNIFFSGYYLDENNNYVVCLTENAPTELTDILTNESIQFIKVTYSYAQLKEVFKIISLNIKEYNFISISLNFKSNKVEITVIDDSIDLSRIKTYIDLGIVSVSIGEEFTAY
ncbi:hypothetical protein [Peloplasma aerotolerans]|uniref:Uncharacterized protein n=1 Tax=Peloplasma aerotolerans TaxID=3044389 RepID=A0AAW6U7G7_9MOLU|nr:hypothetical protein [Mariniplasma sp. M4Ah]MDI6452720.1 hypothetical protein [Mariniplasma sp. M4Ah]